LFYVDDSGSPESRLVVFSWVELLVVDWSSALRVWLDWRRHLHTTVGIPASYELHATKFAGHPARRVMWEWYPTLLGAGSITGATPQQI
jgi:hypothetical protein